MTKQQIKPIENKAPPAEKLAKVFDTADKQVIRLTRLVEDLLDVSRIQSGNLPFEFQRVNLSEIVKDTISRFSSQFEKSKNTVHLNIQSDIHCLVDIDRIEQLLENLITNIIKYAPGKPIDVTLSADKLAAKLSVQDYGPGIPSEMHAKIFEPFERANLSKAVTGLGLGLFIVREIVKAHQGAIFLESCLGSGSKFVIEFPLKGMNESQPLDHSLHNSENTI